MALYHHLDELTICASNDRGDFTPNFLGFSVFSSSAQKGVFALQSLLVKALLAQMGNPSESRVLDNAIDHADKNYPPL